MTQTNLAKILTRRYDVGREIKFILYKDELLSDPIDLTDYTVVITVIKPDNNFVIENFVGDTVTITEQMEVVTGTGYYCVHVSKDNETIYTGQGEFIIDDVLISDGELESISEVNGLKFPDDFLTVEDHVAVIDDTVTSTEKTWSSSKISDEIENVSVVVSKTAEGNPIELTDAADVPLVECVTEIQGSQDLHGQDKPWVGGAGKNKAKIIISHSEPALSEITVDGNIVGVVCNNAAVSYVYTLRVGEVNIESGKTYTLSGSPNGYSNSSYRLDCRIHGTTTMYKDWNEVNNATLTATESTTVDIFIRVAANYAMSNVVFHPQIEEGSSATSFSPYSNICPITAYTEGEIEVSDGDGNTTTHTTTFPSAIYRGSEDCVNGEVTEDYAKITITSSNAINRSNDHQFYWNGLANGKPGGQVICDKLPYGMQSNTDCIFINSQGALRINTSQAFATANALKAWLMPIEIAYELNTPTTSSVTPTNLPIKSLSGYNHIESSTGDMEVEYITEDYQPLVDSIVTESERKITKLWDAGFTPSPGVWLEYDFGEDLENYDAIVILFVVSGWEGNNSDSVTVYPKIQNLNTTKYYHYIKGSDYGIQFWHVSGTTYGLGSIDGNYPPQYKAVYGIKY